MRLLFMLMLIAGHAHAAATDAARTIAGLEGVYKRKFMNSYVHSTGDEMYESEDIIEIVRYDDKRVYFRVDLAFINAHSCSISGIAPYEKGKIVYSEPAREGEKKCTFTLRPTKDAIRFTDMVSDQSSSCHFSHCSMRGSLTSGSVPKKSRRPIRYMDRLKKSIEYEQALERLRENEASHSADKPRVEEHSK
jgi:hypothetical protein